MRIEELKLAVSRLKANNFALCSQWFDEFRAQQWDRQIEADILTGKLDPASQRADDDFESGRCTIINETSRR